MFMSILLYQSVHTFIQKTSDQHNDEYLAKCVNCVGEDDVSCLPQCDLGHLEHLFSCI